MYIHVTRHAQIRFFEKHPGCINAITAVQREIREGKEMSPALLEVITGRRKSRGGKREEYIVAPDCHGIFVIIAEEHRKIVVTYLRMQSVQRELLIEWGYLSEEYLHEA